MNDLRQALADIRRLMAPYFTTREPGTLHLGPLGLLRLQERWIAWIFVVAIAALALGQVGITVKLSYINRDLFSALQEKSAEKFWDVILLGWVPWVAVLIAAYIVSFVIQSVFRMRWRAWATDRALHMWLSDKAHYRLGFVKNGVDNPDQRISEDIRKFVETTVTLSVGLLRQVTTLVSFAVILWTISSEFALPGTNIQVPGLLLWVALAYAVLGTWIAHLIGRKLVSLNFVQEKVEANFRFGLARLREYSESIALLDGEKAEINRLLGFFRALVGNFFAIVRVQKWLAGFQAGYGSASSLVPFMVGAPYYFSGRVDLGTLMQTADAFGSVQGAMSYFIDSYAQLAEYKAVTDRLTSFERSAAEARSLAHDGSDIARVVDGGADLGAQGLALDLPDGRRIVEAPDLSFAQGQSTLIVGPSGSGKSTLFRAISGLWPFGRGRVDLPQGRVMILPQRSYLPTGTLREALAYPGEADAFAPEDVARALETVELGHLAESLDEEAVWTQRLSGGEQQRLAFARALLARPQWLLLDEATSALDEALEARIYRNVAAALPDTTMVSIGHRSTLLDLHQRRLEMRAGENGVFTPVPVPA